MLVRGDFNGLFDAILCLAHGETCTTRDGDEVTLKPGLEVTAFEPDDEDGERVFLVASGIVEPAPDWLVQHGSRWVLRIDSRGLRRERALDDTAA